MGSFRASSPGEGRETGSHANSDLAPSFRVLRPPRTGRFAPKKPRVDARERFFVLWRAGEQGSGSLEQLAHGPQGVVWLTVEGLTVLVARASRRGVQAAMAWIFISSVSGKRDDLRTREYLRRDAVR